MKETKAPTTDKRLTEMIERSARTDPTALAGEDGLLTSLGYTDDRRHAATVTATGKAATALVDLITANFEMTKSGGSTRDADGNIRAVLRDVPKSKGGPTHIGVINLGDLLGALAGISSSTKTSDPFKFSDIDKEVEELVRKVSRR